jgi:histidyl-tRNA synthetase
VAHYQSKLPRLFRRYQIQPVWRADRPGRGRFREFYQCDVDALGSTSPVVEVELCAAAAEALVALGFNDFTIRLNHRQLLTALLEVSGVPGPLHASALVALDKFDKVGRDGVASELDTRGVTADARERLLAVFQGETASNLDAVARLVGADDQGRLAVENLAAIVALASDIAAAGRLRFDASLARGLSYYTGAIMEITVPDLAGSMGGGGRYDDLVGMFLGQRIPAAGFSLGLERILVIMSERGMFPASLATSPADVMVAAFDAPGGGPPGAGLPGPGEDRETDQVR